MDALTQACSPAPGYLDTASPGVPPTATAELMSALLTRSCRGQLSPPEVDDHVRRARAAFAALSGVQETSVAIGAGSAPKGDVHPSLSASSRPAPRRPRSSRCARLPSRAVARRGARAPGACSGPSCPGSW